MSKHFTSRAWFAALFVAVAFVTLSCQAAQTVANVESGAKKIAVFKGGDVTLAELQELANQAGLGEISPGSPQFDTAVQQLMPQLVEIEIAKAYAREHGITVSDKQVDQEIENIKDQIYQQAQAQGANMSREEAFAQALQGANLTEDELRAQVREQLPVQKVQEQVTKGAKPSQEEIQTFYEQNKKAQFTSPEQRCVRHILFNKDQKQKAEEVKKQLENGGDFDKLAKQYSQDPGSAAKGGDLGCIGKGETVPSFEEAAFNAKVGEIVGPVESQFGYHLIEVTDIRSEHTKSLKEVEGQIRAQLTTNKQSQEFSAWIEKQKKQRDVKYLPDYKPSE